ncbi:MAG: GNAT family N-acetyltransferase [Candidatus Eremiobacteraeota bacterium]|nr:GNAT family N-acetyltransferase [Candidatus Eremiobacteraeota bacterium]
MRPLRTQRLTLTPVTVHNATLLWNVLQQPDLRRYQDLPTVGAAAFAELVSRRPKTLRPGAWGRFEWLVYFEGFKRAAGWISLRIAEREPDCGEIGYSIVREFRSRGIATEAVGALVAEGFERAELATLRAYCVPQNEASRRVLENTGFTFDRVLPHGASVNGEAVDVLSHVLTETQWRHSGKTIEIPASA